jgi:hypothetical protein
MLSTNFLTSRFLLASSRGGIHSLHGGRIFAACHWLLEQG